MTTHKHAQRRVIMSKDFGSSNTLGDYNTLGAGIFLGGFV